MTCSRPMSGCTGIDVRAVRRVGDQTRTRYQLCAACRAALEAPQFAFEFLPADVPEWILRGREGSNRGKDLSGRIVA